MAPPILPLPLFSVPLSPPPPPTAINRFTGNVTLLSRRATFTGEVNADVVIAATARDSTVNVFGPIEIAIQLAGNGGVCVE